MTTRESPAKSGGKAALVVYTAVVIGGSILVSFLHHAARLSFTDRVSGTFVLALMWVPASARLAAIRTFDHGWFTPFPVRRWGRPWFAPVVVPVGVVSFVYFGAYLIASGDGIPHGNPVWRGASAVLNIAVNLPLLAVIGAFGAIGEELGWRGYLQPRLDQLQVPCPLAWVTVIETAFHVPLILLAGYAAGESRIMSVALFLGLKIGATTVWTWATYRWRTIWMAVGFHTLHNAVSQVIAPKLLGDGDPRVLGEYGLLPVALYFVCASVLVASDRWRGIARETV